MDVGGKVWEYAHFGIGGGDDGEHEHERDSWHWHGSIWRRFERILGFFDVDFDFEGSTTDEEGSLGGDEDEKGDEVGEFLFFLFPSFLGGFYFSNRFSC